MGAFFAIAVLKFIAICVTVHSSSQPSQNKKTDVRDVLKKSDYKTEFERVQLVYSKDQYVKMCRIITFKYNRTSAAINITWEFRVDVGYDYNIVIQAYKFYSNEYRLFPLRFQFNFCEAFLENIVGVQTFIHCGNFTGCPLLKNERKRVCNWSPDQQHFPPYMPSGKYMIEIQGFFGTEELYLVRGYFSVYRPILKK